MNQPAFMGNRSRRFYGEAKAFRGRAGPSGIGLRSMRLVERRINLDGVETLCIALEMAVARRKLIGIARGQTPSRHADQELAPAVRTRLEVQAYVFHGPRLPGPERAIDLVQKSLAILIGRLIHAVAGQI